MRKILIIDDEFIFRQGLRYMMDWEACGFTIAGEASNGQDALEQARELKPDLVLCDVVMPVMNGVEFVHQNQKEGGPPVIMLSNFDEFDKVRQAFQYGASDYLLKNRVTKETLLKCLERIPFENTPGEKDAGRISFESLVRQALDGYAPEPFEELQLYLNNRMDAQSYQILYVDHPMLHFQTSSQLLETVERMLPTASVCCTFTTQNHGICIIGSPSTSGIDDTRDFLDKLAAFPVRTGTVLSTPLPDVSKFKAQAEALSDLSRYSVLYDNCYCFSEADLNRSPGVLPVFQEEIYLLCSSGGQWKKACEILLSYTGQLKNTTLMNPYQFKKFVEHAFYQALLHARSRISGHAALNRIEIRLFKAMDQATSYPQIASALTSAYEELDLLLLTVPAARQADSLISSLHRFLEDHYQEQVTLYDAAEHLHMNYSYLSAYISQNTARHFSEHLNDIRVQHAKQLLTQSGKSISQISESIGYADQSYFGKIFKKTVGVTPLQYRNTAHGKKDRDA